jgi:hypothetical protein
MRSVPAPSRSNLYLWPQPPVVVDLVYCRCEVTRAGRNCGHLNCDAARALSELNLKCAMPEAVINRYHFAEL